MTMSVRHLASASRTGALLAALVTITSPPARAQGATGGRFQAWLGCWSAEQTIVATASTIGPIVCITPTPDPNVVEVATLREGKVASRETLDAGGRERPIEAKGCTGTRRADWSRDGRRVYLKSAGSCEGVPRSTSGILAITPSGEWLDVQGIAAGEGANVRVARYRDVGMPRSAPPEIVSALAGRDLATESARISAGAPVRIADIVEASRAADSAVVEAWILERGQRFDISGRELATLADAGVPARVTDALVAVSNPQAFALARADEDGMRRGRGPDLIGGRGVPGYPGPYDNPWGWGAYSPYGYGNGYGGYYGYPGFYNPPVVIVRGNGEHGRMVKGEGYTKGGERASTGGDASTAKSPAPAKAPSERPAGGRTAKPRD